MFYPKSRNCPRSQFPVDVYLFMYLFIHFIYLFLICLFIFMSSAPREVEKAPRDVEKVSRKRRISPPKSISPIADVKTTHTETITRQQPKVSFPFGSE